jgi:transposase
MGPQWSLVMARIDYKAELYRLTAQVEALLQRNEILEKRNQELEAEVKRLTGLLSAKGAAKGSKPPKFKENYSVEQNTGKRHQRRTPSTGRRPWEDKLDQVNETLAVYGAEAKLSDCIVHRDQFAWRIRSGQAQYIHYQVYGLPDSDEIPSIPGLRNSRSEYGLEIILMVAYLHYWIGLSLDHTCEVIQFFTGLSLSKSQAHSLLNQLSQDWSEQYDTIAELLARQLVIYIDETGWQVGQKACYTWTFSTVMHVLFRCGVGRGKAEAEAIVGEMFPGIGVTDDYRAYEYLFNEHQLCWAHLLRKAIKLMLQQPDETSYAQFFRALYAIYQQAVRWQKDQRLSVGRVQKVADLKAKVLALCTRANEIILPDSPLPEQALIKLQAELVRGIEALFVFVEHPEVEATNNRSERNIRHEAEIRKGGRTSKSDAGAERRGIIMTVLATLNTRFEKFTLNHLISEVTRWAEAGVSIFQAELAGMRNAHAPPIA